MAYIAQPTANVVNDGTPPRAHRNHQSRGSPAQQHNPKRSCWHSSRVTPVCSVFCFPHCNTRVRDCLLARQVPRSFTSHRQAWSTRSASQQLRPPERSQGVGGARTGPEQDCACGWTILPGRGRSTSRCRGPGDRFRFVVVAVYYCCCYVVAVVVVVVLPHAGQLSV